MLLRNMAAIWRRRYLAVRYAGAEPEIIGRCWTYAGAQMVCADDAVADPYEPEGMYERLVCRTRNGRWRR